jgi:hypothetical protein
MSGTEGIPAVRGEEDVKDVFIHQAAVRRRVTPEATRACQTRRRA